MAYSLFPASFINEFTQHIEYKVHEGRIMPESGRQQIEKFKEALIYTENQLAHQDMISWSTDELISFICELHKITTNEDATFRTYQNFTLRLSPKNSGYKEIYDFEGIVAFLLKNYSNKMAINFLLGCKKFFIVKKFNVSEERVNNFQMGVIRLASKLNIPINLNDFSSPMTEDEESALNLIYKFFVDHDKIPQRMKLWAEKFLNGIQSNFDPYIIYTDSFLEFAGEIHPFTDGNGRTVKIFLAAFFIRNKILPSYLNSVEAILTYRDTVGMTKIDKIPLLKYLRKNCPRINA